MKIALIFFLAVLSEVIATSALKFSEGFTKPVPTLIVTVGYGLSFYLLSLCLKVMPIGTAYAVWTGIGAAGTAVLGVYLFGEAASVIRVAGVGLIVVGVALLKGAG